MRAAPFLLALALAAAAGCSPLPEQRAVRGLYQDLRKTVQFRESNDWVVDELEVEDAAETVMHSVCKTDRETREDLRMWLEQQIEAEGGPSRAQYEAEGEMNGQIREARRLERVRALLDRVEDAASECPYWVERDERYAGLEGDEGRFVVFLESRGGGAMLLSKTDEGEHEVRIGGGGGGRLMPGFGISRRLTLAIGFEVGVDGRLPENAGGSRSFEAVFATAVPLLLRITDMNRVVALEISLTSRYEDDTRHGFRVGIGYGLTTPRVAGLMPYGVAWIGYQQMPSAYGLPTEHTIWLGTRVGFDWAPGSRAR